MDQLIEAKRSNWEKYTEKVYIYLILGYGKNGNCYLLLSPLICNYSLQGSWAECYYTEKSN